jgi:hypothetical protein
MENYISEQAEKLNIKTKNIQIIKSLENGWSVEIKYDRGKEQILNRRIKKEQIRRLLTEKVKNKYGNWSKFNKNVKKSHRNKESIINKILSLDKVLNHLGLKVTIVEKSENKIKLKQ